MRPTIASMQDTINALVREHQREKDRLQEQLKEKDSRLSLECKRADAAHEEVMALRTELHDTEIRLATVTGYLEKLQEDQPPLTLQVPRAAREPGYGERVHPLAPPMRMVDHAYYGHETRTPRPWYAR